MAYSGTTAASSVSNPPIKLVGGVGAAGNTTSLATGLSTSYPGTKQGNSVWFYSSTNATTDIVASAFFTDGQTLGMRPGDMIMGQQFTSAGSSVTTFWGSITGVSTSGASLSTGSLVTSTFN